MTESTEAAEPRYEHYFVVCGTKDPITGAVGFEIDNATAMARFDDRAVWDSEDGDWIAPDDDSPLAETDTAMYKMLTSIIDVDDDGIPTAWTDDDARAFVSLVVKRYGLANDYNEVVAAAAVARVGDSNDAEIDRLWESVHEANAILGLSVRDTAEEA